MKLPGQLIYTDDSDPGFSRRRHGKGFAFYSPDGSHLKDPSTVQRLKSLALPPAYQDVWYCLDPKGHLQATGYDSRGRKQYRYHQEWEAWRQTEKFNSMAAFGSALPSLRNSVTYHLAKEDFSKDHILASVVRLLDKTAARIGNENYYQDNGTAGLTTLRSEHAESEAGRIALSYTAKGGEERHFDLYQPVLSKIISKLQDLPGQRLFKYRSGDEWHAVDSGMINDWLKEKSGLEITAKDFRTWHASRLTLDYLLSLEYQNQERARISQETEALLVTSKELGHRPPVCRKHYVHPEILAKHRAGTLKDLAGKTDEERLLNFLEAHPLQKVA